MLESKNRAPAPADLEACSPPDIKRKLALDASSWMSGCVDAVLVSSLSLPGTHDSSAYTQPWPFVATQTMDITQQLDAGIRYLDLRCGIVHNVAEMVHGPRLLGLQLHKLLDLIYQWLDVHATEGLVVQIKEDRKSEQSTLHFAQIILDNIAKCPERWRTANTTPCLGELRGKIQLLRRYNVPSSVPYSIGIDVTKWQDNPSTPFTIHTWHQVQLTIQDHYSFSEPLSLPNLIASKGGDVAGLLEKSSTDLDPCHWYINFTSAYEFNLYYQLTPRAIAIGGYYSFHWEDGMNPRLRNYLRVRPGRRRLGIVAMDFPDRGSEDLIELIIRSNFGAAETMWLSWLTLVVVVVVVVVVLTAVAVLACCSHVRTAFTVGVIYYGCTVGLHLKNVCLDT